MRDRLLKQSTLTDTVVSDIMLALKKLRTTLRARSEYFDYRTRTLVLSFFGFGNTLHRNNMMWAFRHALKPTMLYCSQTALNQWEGIMVLHLREGTLLNAFSNISHQHTMANGTMSSPRILEPVDAFIQNLSTTFDLFNLSVQFLDLDTWTSKPTVTCITRIEGGTHKFGNLHHPKNLSYLHAYLIQKREIEDFIQNNQVRAVTGRDFTVGNMLEAFHDARNAEMELARMRNNNTQILQHIALIESVVRNQRNLIVDLNNIPTDRHSTRITAPLSNPPPSQRYQAQLQQHHTAIHRVNSDIHHEITTLRNFVIRSAENMPFTEWPIQNQINLVTPTPSPPPPLVLMELTHMQPPATMPPPSMPPPPTPPPTIPQIAGMVTPPPQFPENRPTLRPRNTVRVRAIMRRVAPLEVD